MKKPVRCNEIEAMILAFINDDLEYEKLVLFLDHIETCHECKEEMIIQYLVIVGIIRLEEGEVLDLNGELNAKIEVAKKRVKQHKGIKCIGITMEVIGMVAIIGVVIFMLLK